MQIRLEKCPTWATHALSPYCVQAIAVRAGRDIFIADFKAADRYSFMDGFYKCDDKVFDRKVMKDGDGYMVNKASMTTTTNITYLFEYELFC